MWIVQVLLAALFLFAGGQKLMLSREALIQTPMGGYAKKYSANVLKLLGALEVLGAIGLIFALADRDFTLVNALAATGLALVMVGATYVRLQEKRTSWR
ncbi:MAG: DoxX family protein [Chloroflexi bacterium]|nr:DoxX family protein [Chloroflexota bacterium]